MLPAQVVWKAQTEFHETGDFTDKPYCVVFQRDFSFPKPSSNTYLGRKASQNRQQNSALSGQLSLTVWFWSVCSL